MHNNTENRYVLSESRLINTSVAQAFKKLILPEEQMRWNSLYIEASISPNDEIKNGAVMTGIFKGSGRATVVFENVIPNTEFTHYSKMKLLNTIPLGEFRHNYKLEDKEGRTQFTQTVSFEPKGLGLVLKSAIMKAFKKRLPESFDEFQAYVEEK